jgi:hypothetical protein
MATRSVLRASRWPYDAFLFFLGCVGRSPRGHPPSASHCPCLVEDGLDGFLPRSELGGDVHQLACVGGGLATHLADQIVVGRASEECTDDVEVSDVGELGVLFEESVDVLT